MAIPSDLEIARAALLKPLDDIARELGIGDAPAGAVRRAAW